MSAAAERAFARRVLDTLAVADGKRQVFGRTLELTFDTTDLDADYVLERIAHLVMARDNAAIVSSRRFIDSDKGETA